jgi:hypothetical protein
MQAFSRRGFQLRTASFETRLAYTAFLWLCLLGLATLIALSFGRTGASPAEVATYYRGDGGELKFPKTFWQLVEVSHFHLFTIPVVVLILSHLLYATPLPVRLRVGLTVATFAGAFLDALGPWAVRYVSGACAYGLMLGWGLLALGSLAMIVLTMIAMWGPRAWLSHARKQVEDP